MCESSCLSINNDRSIELFELLTYLLEDKEDHQKIDRRWLTDSSLATGFEV